MDILWGEQTTAERVWARLYSVAMDVLPGISGHAPRVSGDSEVVTNSNSTQ